MMDALRTMSSAGFSADDAELNARGRLLPPGGLLANVSVISQLIRLVPVLVAASGTTIVVAVSVLVVAAAVSLTHDKPTQEECDEQRDWAEDYCMKELKKINPPLGVVGRRRELDDCVENNIHEDCGGKQVDREKSPRYDQSRPGRRF